MHKIDNDLYQASIALAFMLLSAFLLLFSFGNEGEAGLLTFFYLALILLLGIFLYVVAIRRIKKIAGGREESAEEDGEIIDSYGWDEPQAGSREKKNGEDSLPETESFIDDLLKQGNHEEAPEHLMERFLSTVVNKYEAVQGIVYLRDKGSDTFCCVTSYALYSDKLPEPFEAGVTLTGQVAKNQEILNIDNIPDGYMTVLSGLGSSYPRHLLIVPFVHQGETVGVTEIASFRPFTGEDEQFFSKAGKILGKEITVRSGKKISA